MSFLPLTALVGWFKIQNWTVYSHQPLRNGLPVGLRYRLVMTEA